LAGVYHVQAGAYHICFATAAAYGAYVLPCGMDNHLGAHFAGYRSAHTHNGRYRDGRPFTHKFS
jgi:hypothetical protein